MMRNQNVGEPKINSEPKIQMNRKYKWTKNIGELKIIVKQKYRWTENKNEPKVW